MLHGFPIVLPKKQNICTGVLSQNKIYERVRVRMNEITRALHAPERVRIFYAVIKHGYRCFISIIRLQYRVCLCNALHCFRKLILTGCCLVTRTIQVTSTDLEQGLKSVETAIY